MAEAPRRGSATSPVIDADESSAAGASSSSSSVAAAAPADAPVPLAFALNTLDTADARNGVWSSSLSTLVVEELHGGRLQFAACHTMLLNEAFLLRELAPALTTAEVGVVIAARYCQDLHRCVPPFPRVEYHKVADENKRGMAHAKALVLCYPSCCRVVITSGNLIRRDFERKTQSIWWQDFPLKQSGNPLEVLARTMAASEADRAPSAAAAPSGVGAPVPVTVECSEFEAVLLDFHRVVAGRGKVTAMLPALSWIPRYDFSCALAQLVTSVPSWESGRRSHAYGHMRLRYILQREAEAATAAGRAAAAPGSGSAAGFHAAADPIAIDVENEADDADAAGDRTAADNSAGGGDVRTLVIQVSSFGDSVGAGRHGGLAVTHDIESCGYIFRQLVPSMLAIHGGSPASPGGTTDTSGGAGAASADGPRKRPPDTPAMMMAEAPAAKRAAGSSVISPGAPLQPLPPLLLMVPSINFVQDCNEGWMGGESLHFSYAAVTTLLNDASRAGTMRVYNGSAVGRERSSPHIKTLFEAVFHAPASAPPRAPWQRSAAVTAAAGASAAAGTSTAAATPCPPVSLSWVYTGSHNLSDIAWGQYPVASRWFQTEVGNNVRNYELGVVVTPHHYARALVRLRDQQLRLARGAATATVASAGAAAGAAALLASPAHATTAPAASASAGIPSALPRVVLVPADIADWHEAGPVTSLTPSTLASPAAGSEERCSSSSSSAGGGAGSDGTGGAAPLPPVLHVLCPIPCVLPGDAYPPRPMGADYPWFQIFKKRERLPGAPPEGYHKVAGHDIFKEDYALRPQQDDSRSGSSSSRPLPPGWPHEYGSTTRRRMHAAAAAAYDTDDSDG